MTPAAQLAELLLERYNMTGKADLSLLCRQIGLRVREKEFDGLDGVLMRSKTAQKGVIGVNARIREYSRKRFTIAHEIGHFVIPYHRNLSSPCVAASIDAFSFQLPRPELEANEFAAELLLPGKQVAGRLNLENPSLLTISDVAAHFETSLSATTWRFLELTQEPSAMVWSSSGRPRWYRKNEALPFAVCLDSVLFKYSMAVRLFAGEDIEPGPRQVDAGAWFFPSAAEKIRILFEQSVYLSNYDAVLTLLWAPDIKPEKQPSEGDDLLEELDPQEFTLTRKRWPR